MTETICGLSNLFEENTYKGQCDVWLRIYTCCIARNVLFNFPDLVVQAKSGTGKTCVFSVIALESITTESYGTQVSTSNHVFMTQARSVHSTRLGHMHLANSMSWQRRTPNRSVEYFQVLAGVRIV